MFLAIISKYRTHSFTRVPLAPAQVLYSVTIQVSATQYLA